MIVGSAEIKINADGKGFGPQLQGILASQNSVVRQSGKQAGGEYGKGVSEGMSGSLRNAMRSMQRELDGGIKYNGHIDSAMAADIGGGQATAAMRATGKRIESEAGNSGKRAGSAFGDSFGRVLNSRLAGESIAAAKAFQMMYSKMSAMTAAAGSGIGAISTLVSGLGALIGAAGSAAASLAAIGPAVGAMAQGGIAASVAFKGVGQAISAGMSQATAATKKSTAAAADNSRGIISAQRAIADARQRVADVVIANADRMREADKKVADAVDDLKDAEKELTDAQKELTDAQRNLTAARKDAREELQQLAFSAEDAALAEQRAGLSLEDAYAKLQAVQNLPPDNKVRREAELSFKEAELNYREAKDRAQDLGEEQAKAAAAGIKGTKAYQSAQKDVTDAQKGVVDGQKGVADAEEKLADARADRAKAAMQNARDLAKAQLALKRSQEDLAAAQKASASAQTASAAAVDKYAEALKGLAPSAQDFVKYMISSKDKFNDLKKSVQEPFFAKFTPAFKDFANNTLPDLAKKLSTTSGIMGQFSKQILGALDIQRLGPIMDQNNKFLKKFSSTAGDGQSAIQDLVSIFGDLYKAISPLTNRFGNFLTKVLDSKADFLESKDGLKSLTDFFDRAGDRMSDFFDIFKSLVGVFKEIFKDAEKPIDDFLDYLKTSFSDLNTAAENNAGEISKHFAGVVKNMEPMLDLVGQLALMFLKMGSAPELGKTFKTLQGALPFIQTILDSAADSGPVFADLVVQVAKLVSTFADDGGMKAFFKTLGSAAGFLNKVLDNDLVKNVLKVAGPLLGILHAVGLIKLAFGQVGKVILGTLLKDTKGIFEKIFPKSQASKMFTKGAEDGAEYARGWATTASHVPVQPTVAGGKAGAVEGSAAAVVPVGGAAGGAAGGVGALEETEKKSKGVFARMGAGLKGIGSVAGKLFGIFNVVAIAAGVLIPIFTSLYNGNDKFKKAIDGLLGSLGNLFSSIVSALAPALKVIGDTFSNLFKAIGPSISNLVSTLVTSLAPVVEVLVGVFGNLLKAIGPVISLLVSSLAPIFTTIATTLTTTVLPVITQLISTFITGLMPVIQAVAGLVVTLVQTFAGVFSQILATVLPVITNLISLFVAQLLPAIMGLLPVVTQVFGVFIGVFQQIVPLVLPIILQMVDLFVKTLIPVIQELGGMFTQIFGLIADTLKKLLPVVLPVIMQIVSVFVDDLIPAIVELVPIFADLFKQIITTVAGLVAAILPMVMQLVGLFIKTLLPAILALLPVFIEVFQQIIGVVLQLVPVLLPVIMQIVGVIVQLLIPAFLAIMPVIQQVVQVIVGVITQLLPVILPVIMTLIQVIVAILIPAIKLILDVVVVVFKVLVVVIKAAIVIVTAVLKAIVFVITDILIPGIKLIIFVVQSMAKFFIAAVKLAFTYFQFVWNSILKPAIQAVRDAISKIVETAQKMNDAFQKAIKAAFKFFQDMYDQYVKPVFDALKKGFDKIGEWAASARDSVGKGFGALVDKIKDPIITALKWINDHLIDTINEVTSHFGLTIKHIPVPSKAEGGPVTGRGGPTEDNLPHMLSNGEFVVKTKSARRIGMSNLMHMNETGELPGTIGTGGLGDLLKEAVSHVSGAIRSGIEKAESTVAGGLTLLYDSAIKPGLEALKAGGGFIGEFLFGIFEKLRDYMSTWGQKKDKERAAEEAAAGYGSGSTTGGSSGARGVWNALRTGGLNAIQAAGVMGNIQAESGFSWNIVQGGGHSNATDHGSAGYGLVQWTPGSKLGAILNAGHKTNTLGNQIWALLHQLSGKGPNAEGRAGSLLHAATSVLAATRAFMLGYERPADQSSSAVSRRNSLSEHWYKEFGKAKLPSGGSEGGDVEGIPGSGWVYPLRHRYRITQRPNSGHRPPWAVDIGAPTGTGVLAASAGTLTRHFAGLYTSYGRYITIAHAHGVRTLYAHLNKWIASSGQRVSKGQLIALSGHSGGVRPAGIRGSHLHYELMPSSDTIQAMARRGVKLASGGVVKSTAGGVLSVIGEAGKDERVEPLDHQGLSVRDRALIQSIVAQMAGQQGSGSSATVVRVYIGNEELKDIVRYEISDGQSTLARALSTGRRTP